MYTPKQDDLTISCSFAGTTDPTTMKLLGGSSDLDLTAATSPYWSGDVIDVDGSGMDDADKWTCQGVFTYDGTDYTVTSDPVTLAYLSKYKFKTKIIDWWILDVLFTK